jgi:hypothetical protein
MGRENVWKCGEVQPLYFLSAHRVGMSNTLVCLQDMHAVASWIICVLPNPGPDRAG